MKWRAEAGATVAGLSLLLASCGTPERPANLSRRPVADMPVKIGKPYRAGGRTWYPSDDRDYDETGLASWYGRQHAGLPTANGEAFDMDGISAAHRTLPLPSYVEVTALGSGRTVLVRVNDRGPFVGDRIIDLSRGAARALGIERDGVARVRVRRVYPAEADRATLRAGRMAAPRGNAPRIAAAPAGTGRYVQVGAFADPDRADAAAMALDNASVLPARGLYLVRVGPIQGEESLRSVLAEARRQGYHDARIDP